MLRIAFDENTYKKIWEDKESLEYYENLWKKVIIINPENDNTITWNEDYENAMYDLD